MKVLKRDGVCELMMFDKVTHRIKNLTYELSPEISAEAIAQNVCSSMYDGISTNEIDSLSAEICVSMITKHPDYETLAARIISSRIDKIVPTTFIESVTKLFQDGQLSQDVFCVVEDVANQDVFENILKESVNDLTYFGLKTLEKGYLKKINNILFENPKYMFLRVSIGIHGDNIIKIAETYKYMSNGYFTHATPTLFNAGTPRPQLSSCFLIAMKEDSIKGIYNTLENCAHISKWAGGIGLNIHNVRANNSKIYGTNGVSDGIIPMLRVFNSTARYVNQAGKRKGSIAIYLEPWHADIMEFLELRLNQGDEESRTRDLFTALWIPDLFMKRVEIDGYWSFFCPNELQVKYPNLPALHDVYGKEFEDLYLKFEDEGVARKTVRVMDVWRAIIKSQIETGTPYMLYKDSCNSKSNQKNIGVIKSSNLCTEILEVSQPDETAVCNLASIALPRFFKSDGTFDYNELHKISRIITYNLNKVIDVNYYPIQEAKNSNMRHRPIGIGVQGLADVFMMMGLPFDSPEAGEINIKIFETIYHGSVTESNSIARNVGPYETFKGSPSSRGQLQFDMWENPQFSGLWDWKNLKLSIKRYGLRNSLLVAPMPTASTSQILGNNECFEPYTTNIYLRRTLAGEFVVINKHLVRELMKLNMWSKEVKDQIIKDGGSVKNLNIPQITKNIFKTVWEISQKVIIDMAKDRGPFIDQSQSLNLFLEDPNLSKVSSMHMYTWKSGLKTGMYYLRSKAKARAIQFTLDPQVCTSCSA